MTKRENKSILKSIDEIIRHIDNAIKIYDKEDMPIDAIYWSTILNKVKSLKNDINDNIINNMDTMHDTF